ncbi:histidine kinase N-terminal 7TM domain-containing protein [Halorubrum sp. AD140]|uniref:histidine kinase N-terminal 7TM domain-containing protein n=1 Tax=Halorubrum sp. AD140 TaxID=3050073 RepID=UPI002ACCDD83|nr:histidine kinase N-terminal 7TM domain-containing protein [Halorubrum sp. AD140]MDZ5811251.1 histidine kinase N-terminal 7TM domain-containing protein [Halorubrum sp. AD140]
MEWQPTPYTAPLLVASVASALFVVYATANRTRGDPPLVRGFVGVALGSGVWSLAYAAQLSAVTLGATLFWNRIVWVGIAVLAVAWPTFVLAYVGRTAWLRPPRLLLLSLVPTTVVVGVLGLGADPLMYRSPSLVDAGGYLVMEYSPTPAIVGFVAYSHGVNLLTFVLLGHAAATREGVLRRQAGLLLAAGAAPTIVGIAGIWGAFGPTFVDYTPVTFAATAGVVGWVVFRHRLLDLSPIARDAVFANLSDGVVVVDATGRIADLNGPARRLFPDAAVGRRVEATFERVPVVVEAARGDRADDEIRVTLDTEAGARFLTVSVHDVDGGASGRRVGSGARRVGSGARRGGPGARQNGSGNCHSGSAGGTVLLFRDVTERETLQRRHRTLIEKSPNVVAVCGTDGLLRYVSPSVERLLGHAPEAIEGRPVLDLVHPDDRLDAQRAFERAFETGEPQRLDHRTTHADGNWRRFETTVERLFDDNREVVITATDVTESRRYEQRLQVLNRVLRHDLKNDTNVIGGYAGLLRDHVDAEGDEYLDVIDRKVETLTHLSDQAREIDVALHSEGGRTAIDLARLVGRLGESLASSYPHATVTVSTPDVAVVSADELLESAVRNVLENAVVHNDRERPTVEATVTADDGGYRLDVADDGPGIPPVERTVFSEARETALEHASGLGLWLVHWIVTESGGEIEIETREPNGTLVTMWLPTATSGDAAGTADAVLDPEDASAGGAVD